MFLEHNNVADFFFISFLSFATNPVIQSESNYSQNL